MKASYVRTAISWGIFQPDAPTYDGDGNVNNFKWDNSQEQLITKLNNDGKKIIPSIRTVSQGVKTGKNNWALYSLVEGVRNNQGNPITPKIECKKDGGTDYKASALPVDLTTNSDAQYAYSKNYYNFVKAAIKYFKDKGINFEIVVIENEMNSPNFWCGTPDQYIRLYKTAVKAVRDVDPNIKVADGGLQGFALDALSQDKNGQGIAFTNGEAMINANMFAIGDLANFHHYQSSENITRIISYLKDKNKDTNGKEKPIFTNEIGSREGSESGQEMVKKFAYLLMQDVRPIVWFSPNGAGEGNNDGALIDDNGDPIGQNLKAFITSTKFLDGSIISREDLSDENRNEFHFKLQEQEVTIMWVKQKPMKLDSIGSNCERYDYQGNKITSDSYTLDSSPVLVVCP
ncbi:MAG: glycosyl hydrolase 53 family protein [Patescibacteria group bacterium]